MKIIEGLSPYEFDTDENGLPTFTQKNIAFLNGILRYDSNYSTSSDKSNSEYQNSYAGLLENTDFFSFPPLRDSEGYDELGERIDVLYKVIESIDKINSTHLSSEGNSKKDNGTSNEKRNKGRAKVAAKIREIGGQNLNNLLENADTEIVNKIADSLVGGKHNFSFATKFCSYVSIHALGKDNYCIYDEILQSVLPYYAYMYVDDFKKKYPYIYKTINATKSNGYKTRNESLVYQYKIDDNYAGYKKLIDEIINGIKNKTGENISYADFDHLVWYYFKGSKNKILFAMSKLPENKVSRKTTTKTI